MLFRNAALLDVERGELIRDRSVLVVDGGIAEVGGQEVAANDARIIDLHGLTLMPGLIDAHVHVTAVTADLAALSEWPPSYVTARSAQVLTGMLDRGFTTGRDVAGGRHAVGQGGRR